MRTFIHKENVSRKDPKWVKNAIENGKAVMVFREEPQENGYVIIRGKEITLDFTPKSIYIYHYPIMIGINGAFSYNGEALYRGEKKFKIEELPYPYELFEKTREDIREDNFLEGEFGVKRIETMTRIKVIFPDGSLHEDYIDSKYSPWESIGRKVTSYKEEEEILSTEEKQWKPSSAFAMGITTKVTVKTVKRKFIRTFEDGETDVIEKVVKVDPRD